MHEEPGTKYAHPEKMTSSSHFPEQDVQDVQTHSTPFNVIGLDWLP
jgi:hypothetical protein